MAHRNFLIEWKKSIYYCKIRVEIQKRNAKLPRVGNFRAWLFKVLANLGWVPKQWSYSHMYPRHYFKSRASRFWQVLRISKILSWGLNRRKIRSLQAKVKQKISMIWPKLSHLQSFFMGYLNSWFPSNFWQIWPQHDSALSLKFLLAISPHYKTLCYSFNTWYECSISLFLYSSFVLKVRSIV